MYQRNEFYEEVRRQAKLHLHDLYPIDRQGKGIVCPLCDNGSGKSGDGLTFIKQRSDGTSDSDLLHCFKCDFSGDIIKLRATERNISYRDAAKELAEELGVHDFCEPLSSFPRRSFRKFKKLSPLPPLAESEPVEQVDYSDFFAEAAKNVEKTDYWQRRGFSLNTCRHFNLGFVAAWNHPKVPNAPKSPRLIVPTSKFSYLARDTRVHIPDSQKKYAKQKVGSVSLFNSAALDSDFPFVVEGELDAVSFYEVGFHALALGSISNVNKFINFIKSRSVLPKCIILALDNDQGGKETSLKLTKQLDQLGIPNVVADNLYGEHKDANEALVADKNSFKQNVETALTDSKKVLENKTVSEQSSSSETADTQKANTGNKDLDAAIDSLRAVSEFNGATVLSKNILSAAAFCKVYEPAIFADFRDKCKKGSVDLKTFDDSIGEFVKPVKKRKKREDKEREFQIERDLAVKRREESLRKRFDDIRVIESLYCQEPSQERDDKIISIIKHNLERNYRGEVKATVNNFELILNCDPCLRGCVGYNSFSYKLTPLRHMPWFDKLTNHRVWTNEDDIGLRNYINRTYDGLSSERILMDVLNEYAHHHSFHPVRDYFNNNVEWDGVPRADSFFIDTLNVQDSEYTRTVTRHWLLAAVSRIFHPGCKWDYCLIVKGDQGAGKSTAFAKLAKQWFNDSISNITNKDAMEGMLGYWIIEFGEMKATKKASNEDIKSFLSRKTDIFRVPYGRRAQEFDRQCVFAATTNAEEVLKDLTGGRRFPILVANATSAEVKQRLEKIDKNYIDQLWAEVFVRYNELFKDGFDDSLLDFPPDVLEFAKQLQADYTEGSELEGLITAYLDTAIPDGWEKKAKMERRDYYLTHVPDDNANIDNKNIRNTVTAVEVAFELFGIDDPVRNKALLRKINEVLAHLKGWRRTEWKRCGVYGQQRIAFERINTADLAA